MKHFIAFIIGLVILIIGFVLVNKTTPIYFISTITAGSILISFALSPIFISKNDPNSIEINMKTVHEFVNNNQLTPLKSQAEILSISSSDLSDLKSVNEKKLNYSLKAFQSGDIFGQLTRLELNISHENIAFTTVILQRIKSADLVNLTKGSVIDIEINPTNQYDVRIAE